MGKGCAWRKGTNFKAYQEAEYWVELEKRKEKSNYEKEFKDEKVIKYSK